MRQSITEGKGYIRQCITEETGYIWDKVIKTNGYIRLQILPWFTKNKQDLDVSPR